MMHLAEEGMKRLSLIFALVILLAGCVRPARRLPHLMVRVMEAVKVMEAITIHPRPKILTRPRGLGIIRLGPITRVIGF